MVLGGNCETTKENLLLIMTFKHFLITQFNLSNFPYSAETFEKDRWVTWTRDRIKIFTSYCLPSIDNQTNKNFTWLIYFDEKTPTDFYWLIKDLEKRCFVEVRFSKGNDGFMKDYLSDIRQLAENNEWIISSRIDNDDIFHKDAMNVIQNAFRPIDEFMISLTSGYTFNLQTLQMGHYFYPECPFISLVEKRNKEEIKSIFFKTHTKWDQLKFKVFDVLFRKNNKATFIIDQPLWIQLVHGKNVSNSEKRGLPVLKQLDLTEFSLEIKNHKYSIWSIPSFYSYSRWKRYSRVIFVLFVKSVFRK